MSEAKNTAILEITCQDGFQFVKDGVTINQSNALNGVCFELFIPTVAIAIAQDNALNALIGQAEADKKAFPLTWFRGWQYLSGDRYFDFKDQEYFYDVKVLRRHPHADIIMQYLDDKIYYPEFYQELWQAKIIERWTNLNLGYIFIFDSGREYRQHPHRESIIQFHACSDADKKRWQFRSNSGWKDCIKPCPEWNEFYEYRLRPRTCSVTLQNGTVLEYPEPVCEQLSTLQPYFYVTHDGRIDSNEWQYSHADLSRLESGVIHLTQQAVEQHLSVMQAINSQVEL